MEFTRLYSDLDGIPYAVERRKRGIMHKSGITLENVKYTNKAAILKLIQKQGAMSRKDIAAEIGLTPAAVTTLCNTLIEDGIIVEKGELQEEKRAGRRKVLVDINYDYKCIVAVSIESAVTHLTITNIKGDVLAGKKIQTEADIEPEKFLEKISRESKLLLWETGKTSSELLGMGICIPGIVDRGRGISIRAYGIWNREIPVARIMERLMQCPVIVENNVKAFAEGELLYGAGKKGDDLLFIKWGPGVGSAIVIGDQLYEGHHHNAAEIGHYIIEPDGLPCRCGRRGCLETRVSAAALVERIQTIYSAEETPQLYQLTEGDKERITPELFIQWAEEEEGYFSQMDDRVFEILKAASDRLARAVVNAMTILAPDRTILFGPMLENDRISRVFLEDCHRYDEKYTEGYIRKSKLSKKIFYIGAAALAARTCFFETGGIKDLFRPE